MGNKKFLYIHIPKTGGTSIATGLSLKCDHSTQSQLIEKFNINPTDYYIFTVCRNPWDRFLSLYFYCTKGSETYKSRNIEKYISFETFCELCYKKAKIVTPIVWQIHYQPQLYFIDNNIDYIGRFECLQGSFDTICNKLEIPQQTLHKQNKTNHVHYTEYYNNKTKDIVYKMYKDDIKYFKYEFSPE